MLKRVLAIFCALLLMNGMLATAASAATNATPALIKTNIPKTFAKVKQDPTYTVVDFWHAMTGPRGVNIVEMTDWFNSTIGKQKKIYVKPIFQGDYSAISTKINAAMQSGNPKTLPDLCQLNPFVVFAVRESPYVIYVEDMMKADPKSNIKDVLNKSQAYACSFKGKQLGLPFGQSMMMMHYNVDAFKAVGLDPNNPPKTIAEYAAAAAKLVIKGKNSNSKPVRYGASNLIRIYQLNTWIARQNGALLFDNDNGFADNPTKMLMGTNGTLKETLTEWKKVIDTGALDFRTEAGPPNFSNGITAMYMESMVGYDTIDINLSGIKDKSKVFEHRMARAPSVHANDNVGTHIAATSVYMFDRKDEAKKKATWEFVKFLASVDVSAYWHVQSGYFPMNKNVYFTDYAQKEYAKKPNKKISYQTLIESADYYKAQAPMIPNYEAFDTKLTNEIVLLSQGKETIDQVVKNIQAKADYLLKAYWDANK